MWRQDPYLERYPVPGGGSIVLELFPDDELRVVDPEGRQMGELAVFSPDGRPDTGALTDKTATAAVGLKSILGSDQESARQVAAGLARRGATRNSPRHWFIFSRLACRRRSKFYGHT